MSCDPIVSFLIMGKPKEVQVAVNLMELQNNFRCAQNFLGNLSEHLRSTVVIHDSFVGQFVSSPCHFAVSAPQLNHKPRSLASLGYII